MNLSSIMIAGMLTLAFGVGYAQSCDSVDKEFDASMRDLRSDGRLVVASGGKEVAVLLSDYALPKRGGRNYTALRKAIRTARSMPITCEVRKVVASDIFVVCLVEGRVSLSVVFEQWGFESSK